MLSEPYRQLEESERGDTIFPTMWEKFVNCASFFDK